MNQERQSFLLDEFFSLTLMALVQRGKLYREDSTEELRNEFRLALRSWLEATVDQYRTQVSDERHFENIAKLADELSAAHPNTLANGRFRIGSAQKALNLYLKYMWCLDRIPAPPHCPFDYVVLSRIPECRKVRWTQLDSIEEYKRIVLNARAKADGNSIAEWELKLYNVAQTNRAGSSFTDG